MFNVSPLHPITHYQFFLLGSICNAALKKTHNEDEILEKYGTSEGNR